MKMGLLKKLFKHKNIRLNKKMFIKVDDNIKVIFSFYFIEMLLFIYLIMNNSLILAYFHLFEL